MEGQQFIEVRRVLSNKVTKENVSIELETLDVSLIKSFRAWHKGPKDTAIKGDMTILILKPDEKPIKEFREVSQDTLERMLPNEIDKYSKDKEAYEKALAESKKAHSMIIQESYSVFAEKMGTKVVVRRLNETT